MNETKFKSDDRVEVTDKDHARFGQVVLVQSVPTKVPEGEQTYDIVTQDSRHQFSATESQVDFPSKK